PATSKRSKNTRATRGPMCWKNSTVTRFCAGLPNPRRRRTSPGTCRKKTNVHDQVEPHEQKCFTRNSAAEHGVVGGAVGYGRISVCEISVRAKSRSPYRAGR